MNNFWLGQSNVCSPAFSFPKPQTQLYQLLAATDLVSLQLPTEANYSSFDNQACVMSPFAILYKGQTGTLNMVANRSVYDIS